MTAARPRRRARRRRCSSTRPARRLPFSRAVLSGRATGVPGVVRMLAHAHRAHGRLPLAGPVRRRRAHRARGLHDQPPARPDDRLPLSAERRAGRPRLFRGSRRHPARSGRYSAQPRLCRFPPPPRRRGPGRALSRRHRAADRRAGPRGRAAGSDDAGGSGRLSAGRARGALPHLSDHPDLRAAAALERGRRAAAAWRCSSGPISPRAARPIRRPGSCSPRRAG